jgi:hypothetical protein
VKPSYRFRAQIGLQRTDADLESPDVEFVTTLWTVRSNYSFTSNMFLDGLVQYDPDRELFNANLRFNLIHWPLSDLFIVFSEQRFFTPEEPIAPGRSVILNFTQMLPSDGATLKRTAGSASRIVLQLAPAIRWD